MTSDLWEEFEDVTDAMDSRVDAYVGKNCNVIYSAYPYMDGLIRDNLDEVPISGKVQS